MSHRFSIRRPPPPSRRSLPTVAGLLAGLLLTGGLLAGTPDVAELLGGFKAASGGDAWDRVSVLVMTGELRTSGLSGSVEAWEELASGRYLTRYDLGVAKGAEGYDGTVPWQRDGSGAVTATDSAGDLEAARNQAWLAARGYWYPQRWPAELSYARRVEEERRSFHVVAAVPEGGRAMEIWLDAETLLLDRVVEQGATETTTTHFSDYREIGDLRAPFAIRSTQGDDASDTFIEVTAIEASAPAPPGTFERPATEIADFEILGGGSSVEIPFELHNNHIYVTASVDGTPERPFLVDTGGMNLLSETAAAELGVAAQGAVQVSGAGEDKAEVGVARVGSIAVGGVRLRDQLFIVLDLDEIVAAEGVELSGLVGFELFRRFVVTIDYAGRRLKLTRPEAFEYTGKGVRVPFRFDDRTPVVEGAIDGIPATLTLDTGSRSGLAVHGPFAAEHELEARYEPGFEALTGWGVGGGVRARPIGTVTLALGELEIPDVAAELTGQSGGAFTDRYTAGNVGGAVLERFTVIFDYGDQAVIFEPNRHFASPDGSDRSGLWLNSTADGLRVEDVVPGGPADEAGLEVGDLVVAVDGRRFEELSLSAVRERLRREPPGTVVELRVRSADGSRRVEIALRDLV